jgi:PAS domain S-box-containing protein
MFEAVATAMAICQLDGRIIEANPALAAMFGLTPRDMSTTQANLLYPEPLSDPSKISGALPTLEPAEPCFFAELVRGERASLELDRYYIRTDASGFWAHLTVSLGRDARNRPSFLITTLADATERVRMQEYLREVESMEVIGRLAGGIAHDFNNLLTGILLYCDLLGNGLQHGELRQHVEEVRRAGEQGAALTQQLLALARKQIPDPSPVPINEVVASTENLLRRLIGERTELVTALDPNARLVLVDPAQLRQVLLNLVLNARDAMPEGGKVRLITRAAVFPQDFPTATQPLTPYAVTPDPATPAPSGTPRAAVSLTVSDNGCGMEADTLAHLFEPFFTTKNPGQGTGLGLANVRRIVQNAGGLIGVQSRPGRGTSIEVFFPAFDDPGRSRFETTRDESALK